MGKMELPPCSERYAKKWTKNLGKYVVFPAAEPGNRQITTPRMPCEMYDNLEDNLIKRHILKNPTHFNNMRVDQATERMIFNKKQVAPFLASNRFAVYELERIWAPQYTGAKEYEGKRFYYYLGKLVSAVGTDDLSRE